MNKKTILLSLIFINIIFNLNAKKTEYISGYPKNINISAEICREEGMLAMLNNKLPKLTISIGGYLMIAENFLSDFIEKNKKNDQSIIEFKRLSEMFHKRSQKTRKEIDEAFEKLGKNQEYYEEKFFKNGLVYDPTACSSCIKEYEQMMQEEINKLDPESKELFEKSTHLLDKICEKYPKKIDHFKKIYEAGKEALHNELIYQNHEKTTNLINELTIHQYQ